MPGLLFRFNKESNLILDPDAIKLAPGLKNLKQDEILFIILAYDYNGPFHQMDERERIRRAMRQAFGDVEIDITKNKRLLDGIEEYKGLQFNIDREMQIAFQTKITLLQAELYNATESRRIKDITDTMSSLNTKIEQLQDKINTDLEARLTSSGDKVTFLEQWKINRKNHQNNRQQQEIIRKKEAERKGIAKVNLDEETVD